MIYVVEGPDGSGKSTLMEQLRATAGKRYFVMMRHSCRPLIEADALRFYDILARANGKLDVVVDRHPMVSDSIYGPILRGTGLLGKYSVHKLISMLELSCTRIVYCRPPEKTIRANLDKQPQLAGVNDKISLIIDAYDRCMRTLATKSCIKVEQYDWTTDTRTPSQVVFGDPV